MLLEAVYITLQAARGRRSHFNFDTQFEVTMYSMMGIGALLLVFAAIALAIQLLRKGQRERPGYRLGSVLGLSFGALATIGFAGYMSLSGSHWVGEHPVGGADIPFFGWSREVGDMRPAHFVALHMMQTLPIVGYAADRFRLPVGPSVGLATAFQLILTILLFTQALEGLSFAPV